MITEQVITYIKDQLTRGVSRDKIRSNLSAAGWVSEDINQAFSFAEPKGESASVKIAPAFAVEDPVQKETPVDKSSFAVEEPLMPILKRDPVPMEANPVTPQTIMSVSSPVSPVLNQAPVSSPVSSMMARPITEKSDIMHTFGDDGEIRKPKKSRALKAFALFLFLIFAVGNAFLWLIAYPSFTASQKTAQIETEDTRAQVAREGDISTTPVDTSVSTTSIAEELAVPSGVLHNAALTYYSKNSTYGTKSATMVSCDAANGVFTDASIKKVLNDMSQITGNKAKCSLSGDDPTKKDRMTSYLVYMPVESAGFCIDSTGAAFTVSKVPTGTFCAEAV